MTDNETKDAWKKMVTDLLPKIRNSDNPDHVKKHYIEWLELYRNIDAIFRARRPKKPRQPKQPKHAAKGQVQQGQNDVVQLFRIKGKLYEEVSDVTPAKKRRNRKNKKGESATLDAAVAPKSVPQQAHKNQHTGVVHNIRPSLAGG